MQHRIKRALHYWLSIPGILLFFLWTSSGIVLVWDSIRSGLHAFPKQVKSGDLRQNSFASVFLQNFSQPVSRISIYTLDSRCYAEIETQSKTYLVDAQSGRILSPIYKDTATELLAGLAGLSPISVRRVTARNYEYKYGELPAWRGEFADGRIIHISESTGSIQSWSDHTGMMVRAFYYYGHAFQFTDSGIANSLIGFFAIFWALASVISGVMLYKKKSKLVLLLILLCCNVCRAENSTTTPQRIVALAPSCAEILAGLGLQDRLVGITEHTDYPPEIISLPKIGSYVDLNLELIVALKPDLAVATSDGNPPAVIAQLKTLSIPVEVLNLQTYQDIERSIQQLGKIVSRERQAKQLSSTMQNVASCIHERTKNASRPTVLFAYETYPIVTAGKDTFTDELVEMAGGSLVTHEVSISYPRLTMENILALDPEIIVQTSMDPKMEATQKLSWWKQYAHLRAVRNGRVFILDSRHLDRPSQLIVDGFWDLARTLHPELFAQEECRP